MSIDIPGVELTRLTGYGLTVQEATISYLRNIREQNITTIANDLSMTPQTARASYLRGEAKLSIIKSEISEQPPSLE